MKMYQYYCVISSNKTKSGKMNAKIVAVRDFKIPDNCYVESKQMWYDYFGNREQALEFAMLLKR